MKDMWCNFNVFCRTYCLFPLLSPLTPLNVLMFLTTKHQVASSSSSSYLPLQLLHQLLLLLTVVCLRISASKENKDLK
jgi:hypothetical protein